MALILVTGMPGVGKTTITKRLVKELQQRKLPIFGFYTEEVRNTESTRVGFDVVSFTGERAELARVNRSCPRDPAVGRYYVRLEAFESIALSELERHRCSSGNEGALLVVDEIGKMELLSREFHRRMQEVASKVAAKKVRLIATVPLKAKGIEMIEQLKRIPGCAVFHVTPSNREDSYPEIRDACYKMLSILT